MLWIDLYFNLLYLFLESSFKSLGQYHIGGKLGLIMNHLLSGSRLLRIISLLRRTVSAVVECSLFFVSALSCSSRGDSQLSLVLISCPNTRVAFPLCYLGP